MSRWRGCLGFGRSAELAAFCNGLIMASSRVHLAWYDWLDLMGKSDASFLLRSQTSYWRLLTSDLTVSFFNVISFFQGFQSSSVL